MSTETTEARMTDNYQLDASRWAKGRNVLVFAALISVLACVAGYLNDPVRFLQSYIVAFAYIAAAGLGAFFFVMVQYLTGSAWSVTMRRIMENIMITLPVGAILFHPHRVRPEGHLSVDGSGWPRIRLPETKGQYLTREFLRAFGPIFISRCGRSGFSRFTINRPSRTRSVRSRQMYMHRALERAGTVPGGGGRDAGRL